MDVLSSIVRLPQFPSKEPRPIGYKPAREVLDHLAANFPELEFEWGPRFTTVAIACPEAELAVSSVEPIRPQLVKELRRLAAVLLDVADRVNYVDTCPSEDEWQHCDEKWFELFQDIPYADSALRDHERREIEAFRERQKRERDIANAKAIERATRKRDRAKASS